VIAGLLTRWMFAAEKITEQLVVVEREERIS
jgi:hypothetical protein